MLSLCVPSAPPSNLPVHYPTSTQPINPRPLSISIHFQFFSCKPRCSGFPLPRLIMPPRTGKRKPSATESNHTQDVAPKKTTRAPRKPTIGTAKQGRGKNAANGAGEGKLLGDASKRRKVLVGDAKKQVQNRGNDLIKFINEMKTRPPQVEKNILREELSSEFGPVLPWMNPLSAPQKGSHQNLPDLMLNTLNELESTVEGYEKLVKKETGIKAPTWMHWEQDAKDLNNLGQQGLKMASKIVNHVIMPDLHALPAKPAENASDIEKLAWELIADAIPKRPEETWGKTAQEQLRAFIGVLELHPATQ
ncbi:hypothetical protein LCI18_009269 [Fusarium solani-melongenae]|uniref:Uncharacterized protein n=1 Tax=Fusarium solani subsp. cucurbitae TaxID=2747967 RepID=A0ACD3ZAJ7_FUSSC|nr:hypothetical protein LCI18_009269 [Fusarium solani-melongenae]